MTPEQQWKEINEILSKKGLGLPKNELDTFLTEYYKITTKGLKRVPVRKVYKKPSLWQRVKRWFKIIG